MRCMLRVRVCARDGCPRLTQSTYCAEHTPRRPSDERQTYAWQKRRREAIEDQPWCSICGSTEQLTLGHLVDHARGGRMEHGTQVECMPCNERKNRGDRG